MYSTLLTVAVALSPALAVAQPPAPTPAAPPTSMQQDSVRQDSVRQDSVRRADSTKAKANKSRIPEHDSTRAARDSAARVPGRIPPPHT